MSQWVQEIRQKDISIISGHSSYVRVSEKTKEMWGEEKAKSIVLVGK